MPNSWRPAAYCRPAGRWASPRPCLRQSPARFAQSGGRCEAEAGNRLWLAKALSRMTRTSKGAAHVGAVEILTKIHQRQEGAEDAGLEVVRQVQAARGNAGQALSVLRQKVHDLALALVTGIAESGFAAHFGAARFEGKREMQNAEALLRESLGRIELATGDLAGSRHRRHRLNS